MPGGGGTPFHRVRYVIGAVALTTRTILVLYSRAESRIASQASARPSVCTQLNELRLQHTTLELGRRDRQADETALPSVSRL